MKPLHKFNNVEKAKLLFELFPEETAKSISCIKAMADMICNDPEEVKQKWEDQFFTADFWIGLARDTRERIEKNGIQLTKSSRRFSDQLFDGYNAFFSIYVLQQCAVIQEETQFKKAVELFFK